MYQKLILDLYLILVNNPKQASHTGNSFTNQIFGKRIIKKFKKINFVFFSNHISSVCHSYVIRMSLVCTRMSFVCTSMSSVCYSYVLVCHPYVTRMSSVCHSYVFVCHPYVTRMYLYVIRMSLVCGFTMNHKFITIYYI